MKTAVHFIVAAFGLAIFNLTATVHAQDYDYITNNGTITITAYNGPGGAVTIPATINGLTVTSIGNWAFQYQPSLTSVTLPYTLLSIGDSGFYNCTNLSEVTIPDGVTSIGESAFGSCSALRSVSFPTHLCSIGLGAFAGCGSLQNVNLYDELTYMGISAFAACRSLTNVTIPNSLTFIRSHAFYSCAGLPSVTIPSSVTNIQVNAFGNCQSLKAITVDPLNRFYSSVDGVLFDKSRTLLVEYPNGKAGSYTIPDGVTTIAGWAFQFSANLPSVTIPSSVTEIGERGFERCSSLSSVFFYGNAPVVGQGVFDGLVNLTMYYLPGTTGWDWIFGGQITKPWYLPNPMILNIGSSYGIQTNTFGFTISWATNATFVVDASTTLANPNWSPLSTNTLIDGYSYFSDIQWTNYPRRFYRTRSQ